LELFLKGEKCDLFENKLLNPLFKNLNKYMYYEKYIVVNFENEVKI
jgi:hypothetical protein